MLITKNVICLICQNSSCNRFKRHYWAKHPAKFNGIEGQLRFDEIEQFKTSLSIVVVKTVMFKFNWCSSYSEG